VNTNLEAVVEPAYPAVRWPVHYTIVLLLCAATFISYIDRTNISVAAIAMQSQLGWNETQKGLVLSSFFVGYLLMMVATGALAHRYGGKIVLGIAVVWWSLFTVLTPPAALISLPALVVARIALGLGEAAVFPASINLIGCWVPPLQRSRAVALLTSSLYLGTVIALPVTGWLVRDFGWPAPFYLFGAGHVGRALSVALAPLPFLVSWIDARPGAIPDDARCRPSAGTVRIPDVGARW